jgi:hypothetical protein
LFNSGARRVVTTHYRREGPQWSHRRSGVVHWFAAASLAGDLTAKYGREERIHATFRHPFVPASLQLEIDVAGTERWLRRSTTQEFEDFDFGEVKTIDGLADFGTAKAVWFKDSKGSTLHCTRFSGSDRRLAVTRLESSPDERDLEGQARPCGAYEERRGVGVAGGFDRIEDVRREDTDQECCAGRPGPGCSPQQADAAGQLCESAHGDDPFRRWEPPREER